MLSSYWEQPGAMTIAYVILGASGASLTQRLKGRYPTAPLRFSLNNPLLLGEVVSTQGACAHPPLFLKPVFLFL